MPKRPPYSLGGEGWRGFPPIRKGSFYRAHRMQTWAILGSAGEGLSLALPEMTSAFQVPVDLVLHPENLRKNDQKISIVISRCARNDKVQVNQKSFVSAKSGLGERKSVPLFIPFLRGRCPPPFPGPGIASEESKTFTVPNPRFIRFPTK
uniref:Uncharacterized protein n=1 Tax=Candidatus Kentrum sp. LFY TaxID=2126342 RepID=A0A450UVE9_9GAMM|nr:MAG: hypothetical protein BECKLFY1418B_GA0070995_10865 [Candidatus Kentron sp. LFY]